MQWQLYNTTEQKKNQYIQQLFEILNAECTLMDVVTIQSIQIASTFYCKSVLWNATALLAERIFFFKNTKKINEIT